MTALLEARKDRFALSPVFAWLRHLSDDEGNEEG